MIESGSLTPGVDVRSFGLQPHTALRIEVPAAPLRPFVTDYHVFDSDGPLVMGASEWVLPAWPAIRIILAERPITLRAGATLYDPLPVASLYGTMTQAIRMTAHGGVTIGASITPLGWSRLFTTRADAVRDRIVPLEEVLAPDRVDQLVAALRTSDQSLQVKAILDTFFTAALARPHRAEGEIAALLALLRDPQTRDLKSAAAALGIEPDRLRRLSLRYFGHPPKVLLRRARFMRALLAMMAERDRADYSLIGDAYTDLPHFLRDARRFLGMTPKQFMAMDTPYLDAVLRARRIVFAQARAANEARSPR